MANFKEVSLGFSEFVSQLIQETFDAILSSQNYQLEKYAALESKLNLPNNAFIKNFISNDEIEAKKYEYFGFKIEKQMVVNENLINFLTETFESNQNLVFNKKLTNAGYNAITEYVSDILVEERKAILKTLINKSNTSNIVVDSGEITAKLELTNLFKQDTGDKSAKSAKLLKSNITLINESKEAIKQISLPTFQKKVDVIDFKDEKSGKTTILIDRKSIENINDSNFQIPNVRLSVQPTKLTETSNLYSEIKITFKTV
ncbi:hypothetical protein NHF50_14340 [Flavobacterium sp. NRK F10]|uniref:hypothetical protein n=1 Tax=Flavobacterium sp. NRK F10 TaxID=2954931 RepID=UPI0020916A0E|nr:hypothetical protein [Flavobacterium sp. NRK F10]MCO6176226.1 hypothetical protein [Flavobacterium sp. NRK F10]